MIQMTRLKLVNWHNFVDDVIDFSNITYLVGVNAVGKTTILDAIRYCLTTNKDFNSAGNKKSGRTLQGSVHQKQRADNDYLRPGHTVSYIAVEFLDTDISKRFVIIARVESENPMQDLRSISQDWYLTKPGYSLDDLPFFIADSNGKRPSRRDEFKLDNKGLDRAMNQTDARRKICRQLGIGDADAGTGSKFNKVFHMGTSLEDITDIRNFIYSYILPEPEMKIENLAKDMRELENLQEVLEESKKKANLLKEIIEALDKATEYDSKVKSYELLLKYARYQKALLEEKNEIEAKGETELKIQVNEQLFNEASDRCEKARAKWDEARQQRDSNDYYKEMENLRKGLEELRKEEEDLRNQSRQFDADYTRLTALLSDLCENKVSGCESIETPDSDAESYESIISQIQNTLKQCSDELNNKLGSCSVEMERLGKEIDELTSEIKMLESGKFPYPKDVENVRDAINTYFEEHGINESAKLLCELLYMNKPEWQEAAESYLNTQRFYIVVSQENYKHAKAAFISLGDKVGSAGLIDTPSLMHSRHTEEHSDNVLSDVIGSENKYAMAYINFRLGDVYCCDNPDELEKHKKSVTKDRLLYQGYILHRMEKKSLFIGQDALEKTLNEKKAKLESDNKNKNALKSEYDSLSLLNSSYNEFMSGEHFKNLILYHNSRNLAEQKHIEFSSRKAQIAEYERSPILQGMLNYEKECKTSYDNEDKNRIDIDGTLKKLRDKLQEIKLAIAQASKNKLNAEKIYNDFSEQYSLYVNDMLNEYAELISKSGTPGAILVNNEQQGNLKRKENARDNFIIDTLKPLQGQYSAEFNTDYLPGLEGKNQYQNAYSTLTKIEIEQHSRKLEETQARCKDRFRKEVLFRMKDDIENARRNMKDINKVMEQLNYGEESYQFLIEGSHDKELQAFYNLIMDKDNKQIKDQLDINDMLDGPASDAFEAQTEEFMLKIMTEVEMRAKQSTFGEKMTGLSVDTYADYRTYLDYDIIVKNNVTGKEAHLSKVSGDGSGGENQAPFYVAICASLLQIYQQNDNCIRLVLLDEAFNKMTGDRIRPMMQMFKQLNLQLVLVATPEKCASIQPFCDTTYSIIKQGPRNTLMPFEGV